MAFTTIYLTNGVEIKKAPVGFSWTMFCWGFFVPLFRQDWFWAIMLLIAACLLGPIIGIISAFFYNKVYIKHLVSKGYTFKDTPGVSDDYLKNYLGYINLPGRI
jgi:hypothetical protein